LKKVTLFTGYIIEEDLIYRDQEAVSKLEQLIEDCDVYEVLSQLNGSFRYIINSEKSTWFGVDHFGGYSLFYQTSPSLNILIDPNKSSQLIDIDDENLCTLLASGFCYGENTIFKNIFECLPGFTYTYDKQENKLEKQEWFRIDLNSEKKRSIRELADLLKALIPKNLPKSYLALTGGIDSRLILSLFRKSGAAFESLTYGTANNPDVEPAQTIAKMSNLNHHLFMLDDLDLSQFFQNKQLEDFFSVGFLGRSLPFECDWVISNLIKEKTSWLTTGFTSFWLRAPYQDYLPLTNNANLTQKIFNTHCRQTLISSAKFKDILYANIAESMSHYQPSHYDSNYDRWNIENRQHKYIINTSNNYRYNNIEVFMPLFDRRFMSFLNNTQREQRLEQKIYMEAIISHIFVGKDAFLKEIPSTNPKFNNQIKQLKPNSNNWKARLLRLDKNNLNRLLRKPKNPMYEIIQSVLMQSPEYLSLTIEEAFPNIKKTISLLYDLKLTNSANHLKWLKKKKVIQLNLLGIEIIGFLVDKSQLFTGVMK